MFTVRAKPTPSGARIDAQARIVFDNNAPIDTPAVFNTIDADPPSAAVLPLPNFRPATFNVSWTGSDTPGGPGYDVFVSVDGGAFVLWLDDTTLTAAAYTGADGHTYAFSAVATDLVGYTQVTPAVGQATTRVDTAAPVSSV